MLTFGLAEFAAIVSIAVIPAVVIYFDAKKRRRNAFFWSTIVFLGLLTGIIGVLIILIYFIYQPKTGNSGNTENSPENSKIGTSELLKFFSENERRVLECLIREKAVTQNELVAKTGLSQATVSRIVGRFEKKGIVVRYRDGVAKKVELRDEFLKW